jgi:hypothetical protein
VLDPFNTGRNRYRFEVNANGVRNDMLYVNKQLQSEWTVIWEAASDVGDGGCNASRAIRRRGEESLWVSRNRTWNPSTATRISSDAACFNRSTQIVALRPLELETRGRDTLKFVYTLNEETLARPFTVYQEPGRAVIVPVGEYSFDDYGFEIDTGRQRRYAARFVYRTGDFYDGERLNLGGEFTWKQSRHFTLRLAYDWNLPDASDGRSRLQLAPDVDQPVPVRQRERSVRRYPGTGGESPRRS